MQGRNNHDPVAQAALLGGCFDLCCDVEDLVLFLRLQRELFVVDFHRAAGSYCSGTAGMNGLRYRKVVRQLCASSYAPSLCISGTLESIFRNTSVRIQGLYGIDVFEAAYVLRVC